MYDELELKDGARLFFAKPSESIAPILVDALIQVADQVPAIIEAHLTQYFVEGDAHSKPVLVIGVLRQSDIPTIIPRLAEKIRLTLPPGEFLDVLPYEIEEMPAAVRATQCQIFTRPRKPWWKLW